VPSRRRPTRAAGRRLARRRDGRALKEEASMFVRTRLAMLLCLFYALPTLATSTGKLTVNGKTANLTHAYAAKRKDPFDKSKTVTYLVFADQEVPAAALFDMGDMMMWADKAHPQILTVTVDADGQVISTSVESPNLVKMGQISGVGKQQLELTANDAKHVVGRFYLPKEEEFFDNHYSYDVRFDAPYVDAPKEPGVESLKGAKLPAGGGEPGKAYLAYTKTIAAGDVKALKKAVASEHAKDFDDPDFAKMFPLVQAMQAKNIKVTGGAVDGDKATLIVTGKDGDATSNGTVEMVREGGAWKVSKESWKTKSD
jgi:hypothetical protein